MNLEEKIQELHRTSSIELQMGVLELNVEILDFDKKQIHYKVSNTPICQYDQHSRARIGVKFFNYNVSEKASYVLYTKLFRSIVDDSNRLKRTVHFLYELEAFRQLADFKDDYNLMSRNCSYEVVQEYSSLKGQMMRRLKFSEEEFIVGLHWLLRDKMIKAGIEQANEYLPGCDFSKKCEYASADYLSNAFGCLFAGCGRWKSHAEYASFNESCTTPQLIEEQLKIVVPKSEWEVENNIR